MSVVTAAVAEVEVSAKAQRRRFTAEYKRKVLQEADTCAKTGEIGALLRREGLYVAFDDVACAARARRVGWADAEGRRPRARTETLCARTGISGPPDVIGEYLCGRAARCRRRLAEPIAGRAVGDDECGTLMVRAAGGSRRRRFAPLSASAEICSPTTRPEVQAACPLNADDRLARI
jgi:hypothetical protein